MIPCDQIGNWNMSTYFKTELFNKKTMWIPPTPSLTVLKTVRPLINPTREAHSAAFTCECYTQSIHMTTTKTTTTTTTQRQRHVVRAQKSEKKHTLTKNKIRDINRKKTRSKKEHTYSLLCGCWLRLRHRCRCRCCRRRSRCRRNAPRHGTPILHHHHYTSI